MRCIWLAVRMSRISLIGGWSSTGRPRADMRSMLCCCMSWIASVVASDRLSELSTSRSCWPLVQSDRISTDVKYLSTTRRPVGCPSRNPSRCIPSLTSSSSSSSRRTAELPTTCLIWRFLSLRGDLLPLSRSLVARSCIGTLLKSHTSLPAGTSKSSSPIMSAMSRRHPQKSIRSASCPIAGSTHSSSAGTSYWWGVSPLRALGRYESSSSASTSTRSPARTTYSSAGLMTIAPSSAVLTPTGIAASKR
mmetsp:Transcript_18438/g.38925  ORF Transcript_18438/g.38925 Transcript_18438/m.38925 type:complete len:249 (+) Transcript_18438:273-1019(+)